MEWCIRLLMAFALGACGGDEGEDVVHVYAASSLSGAFGEMEARYEALHPDVDVRVSYAGSQVLRLQIEEGAPADVFASADERQMSELRRSRSDIEALALARNRLVLIVPRANPAGIRSFQDLPSATRLVVGSEASPIGAYTRSLIEEASALYGADFVRAVHACIVSEESNVRLVRAKVELGEADAAIVYGSDLGEAVRVVPTAPEISVSARYAIASLADGAAAGFVEFALSPPGQAILIEHGFVPAEDEE